MGDGLVGSMVAALRRANRGWVEASRAVQPKAAPRPEGSAWGYLAHPALMPTVFCPSGNGADDEPGEEVTARRV